MPGSSASAHAAQHLRQALQANSAGSAHAVRAPATAEALLLLAQWQGSDAGPVDTQLIHSSREAAVGTVPSAAGDPHATAARLPTSEICLKAAVAAAPANTALAARAWASYADWLFQTSTLSAQPTAAQDGEGTDARAAPDGIAAADGNGTAFRAVQAYCASLSQAGWGNGAGEDHALTLLRILQVGHEVFVFFPPPCRRLPYCSAASCLECILPRHPCILPSTCHLPINTPHPYHGGLP